MKRLGDGHENHLETEDSRVAIPKRLMNSLLKEFVTSANIKARRIALARAATKIPVKSHRKRHRPIEEQQEQSFHCMMKNKQRVEGQESGLLQPQGLRENQDHREYQKGIVNNLGQHPKKSPVITISYSAQKTISTKSHPLLPVKRPVELCLPFLLYKGGAIS